MNFLKNRIEDTKVSITIDDFKKQTKAQSLLIQFLDNIRISIPRFCYHPQLAIAGNCRMCLVEVHNSIKPVASCATNITANMIIYTNSRLVKEARENVMEFLLINHPLDCPICDQGGECDLQDISFVFGTDRGRFYENKRAVTNKFAGPLIKMIMSRCIHCTRCTRFFDEYVGKPFFGVVNRGSLTEIDTYVYNIVNSEISANVTDLCPVGALTTKPNAFTARPWELRDFNSIDILDSYCSPIRVDLKENNKIARILPRLNNNIAESFIITDKIRFIYSVLNDLTFYKPTILNSNGVYIAYTFTYVMTFLSYNLRYLTYKFLGLGKFIDYTTLTIIKSIKQKLLNFSLINDYNTLSNNNVQLNKLIAKDNRNFFGLLHQALYHDCLNALIVVNCNLRYELPLLNVRLRKFTLKNRNNNAFVGLFGDIKNTYVNYNYIHLGTSAFNYYNFFSGKSWVSFRFIFNRLNSSVFEFNTIRYNIVLKGISMNLSWIYNTLHSFINETSVFKIINFVNLKFNYYNFNINLFNDISYINSIYMNCYQTLTSFFQLYTYRNETYPHFQSNNKQVLYFGLNVDVNNFSKFYSGSGFKIYQGIVVKHVADKIFEQGIKVILPTKTWLEYYRGYTLDFKGNMLQFVRVYLKNKTLPYTADYFMELTIRCFLNSKKSSIKFLSIEDQKKIATKEAITSFILKQISVINNYYFTWTFFKPAFFKDTEDSQYIDQTGSILNVMDFSSTLLEVYIDHSRPNIKFNNISKFINHNITFVNFLNNYYANDMLSKVSITLNFCNNLIKKTDNF